MTARTELARVAREQSRLLAPTVPQAPAPDIASAISNKPLLLRLADVQPVPVSWLWPGRIPLGKLTILDGDPGLGKSTVMLDLAARVTTDRVAPDGAQMGSGGVVILTAEDGLADTVRPRLDAMDGDAARVVALEAVRDQQREIQSVTLPDHLDALRQAVESTDAILVIVDPFMAYLGSYINSRIDHDIRRTLAPLARLAEDMGVAVVLIRHLNKSNAGPALYRGGGSIGIIGAARMGLLVAPDPDDEARRVLAVVKSNLAPIAPSLAYRLASIPTGVARVEWEGTSPHSANRLLAVPADEEERSTLDTAVSFLTEELGSGPRKSMELEGEARRLGVSERTLNRARARLGVRAQKVGGVWWTVLPTVPSSEVGTLGTLEDSDATIRLFGRVPTVPTVGDGTVADRSGIELTAARACPKGHPMRHKGADLEAGWVCPVCHPTAAAALFGEPAP